MGEIKKDMKGEVEKIVHTISTTKILIGAITSVIVVTLSVYGFFQKQKSDLSVIVNSAVMPIQKELQDINDTITIHGNYIREVIHSEKVHDNKLDAIKNVIINDKLKNPSATKKDIYDILNTWSESEKKNSMSSSLETPQSCPTTSP
jgi:hypothetical protein